MVRHKVLAVRIPTPIKRDFDQSCIIRGLSRAEVIEFLLTRELEQIHAGREPSYAGMVPRVTSRRKKSCA